MNYLKCQKCGNKMMSYIDKYQDVFELKQSLSEEIKQLNEKKNNYIESFQKHKRRYFHEKIEKINKILKPKNIEFQEICRIQSVIKRINHFTDRTNFDNCLVEELKVFVSKEDFLKAVDSAKEKQNQYKKLIEENLNILNNNEIIINHNINFRNQSYCLDFTAHEAINK